MRYSNGLLKKDTLNESETLNEAYLWAKAKHAVRECLVFHNPPNAILNRKLIILNT